ncbi:hypothetical protein ACAX43_00555 [Paraburkholderia sp. IW21]|uniref:hypothetical protein n=1 Tax=Paraburkholderia sp. IW21 TaxID=3242488 RepID=UPI003521E0CB
MKHSARRPHRQRGQAYVEYVLVTLLIAIVLISGSDTPPITALVAAFKSYFGAYSFTLSLP